MRRLATSAVLLALALVGPAFAATPTPTPTPTSPAKLEGDRRSLYAAGLMLAGSLEVFSPSEAELNTVLQAVRDGLAGKPALQVDDATRMEVQALARRRLAARAEAAKERARAEGEALLAQAAAAPGAQRLPSGLVYRPLAEGTGPSPRLADAVRVRFTGRLAGGKVFDATPDGAAPARFQVEQVLPCWAEALQRMQPGGRARVACPPALAYGDHGAPPAIPPGAALDLELELVAVEPAAP